MNKRHCKISLLNICLIVVVSFLTSLVLGGALYKIPSHEKIEFFISSSYVDTNYFKDKISVNEKIKKINIVSRSISNDYYEESLQTVGIFSDLLIIPAKYLDTVDEAFSFTVIDYQLFRDYNIPYGDLSLIIHENKCYGIVIYDKENNINLFKDYLVFEDDQKYVLCVGRSTPNVYMNPSGKKQTSNALTSLIELIK